MSEITVSVVGSTSINPTVGNGDTVNVTIAEVGERGPSGSTNLADETPQPLGTASAGTATTAARADHVHAVPAIAYSSLTGVPSTFAPAAHTQAISTVTGLQDALDGKQPAGTYATLVNNLVPSANLPSFVDDVVDVGGTLPATGDVGKIYVVSTGTNTNKIYRWSGSTFIEISPSPGTTTDVPEGTNLYFTNARAAAAAPVQSVAGRTGTVTLAKADVGLSNVPNTDATLRSNHSGTQTASTISDFATEAAKYGPVTSVNGQTGDVTVSGGSGSYTLPTASSTVLGGVKVGSGLTITDGVLSRSSNYNPAAAPGAPSGIYWSGNTVVIWNPSPGGTAAYYEVQYVPASGGTYAVLSSSVQGTSTYYSSGSPTYFRVRGYNADNLPGEWGYQEGAPGGSSGGSDARWDLFLPPAPTSVTTSGGSSQVTVSWVAPTVLFTTPVTDYVVQYKASVDYTWTTASDGTSNNPAATVTGLSNGTTYNFRVAAVNGIGQGAWSSTVNGIPGGDPLFSSVSLLLKFEGSAIADLSNYAHTITTTGGAAQTDTQARFGQKSLSLFGGGGDYTNSLNLYTSTSSGFAFGTDPFAIECWFKFTTNAFDGKIFALSRYVSGSSGPELSVGLVNGSELYLWFTGNNSASLGSGYATNVWHHVAVARSGGTMRVYVNGTRKFETNPGWGGDVGYGGNFSGPRRFCIGGSAEDYWNNAKCYVDEVRVTKGSDRSYTGDTITVPAAEFLTG